MPLSNTYKSPVYARAKAITSVIFIISLLVTQIIAWGLLERERSLEQHQVRNEVIQFKNRLETILEYSSTATYTMALLVENGLLNDDFDSLSHQILRQNQFIDAMQLVEGTVITKTYPLEGNESVIGMDISKTPAHIRDAAESIKRQQLYFEGPFELTQGGVGFVGRFPIMKNSQVFGFSAVVIKLATILDGLGLSKSGVTDEYIYQLVKIEGEEQKLLFQNKESFDSGIIAKTKVPLGDWDIHVKLRNPGYWKRFMSFSILGLVFSLILSVLVWKVATQPAKLNMLIDLKTRDLKVVNEQLERRAEELEQYAHVISHDLQEPLRMVVNFLGLLKDRNGDSLDEQALTYVNHASEGAWKMKNLISDLLKYAIAGKNSGKKELIPLRMVLDDAISLLQNKIDESKAVISYTDLPTVYAVKIPLTQIMQNLIGNALKYASIDRAPVIIVEHLSLDDEWEIIVKDNGIGIPSEYYQEVFNIFKRLHKEEYQGTGLGLAMVKKNVESLGGRVWVTSQINVGSEFHFTLPKKSS